jgi:hypothetical protein
MIWKRMISTFEAAVLSRVAVMTLMIAIDLTIDNYDTSSALTPYGGGERCKLTGWTLLTPKACEKRLVLAANP